MPSMINYATSPSFSRVTRVSRTPIVPSGRLLFQKRREIDQLSGFFYYASMVILAVIVINVYPLREATIPDVVDAAVVAINGEPTGTKVPPVVIASAPVVQAAVSSEVQFAKQVEYVLNIVQSARKDPQEARKLAEAIVRASTEANYDPLFVAAVVKAESTFNRYALSYAGARGLMQILPGTGKYISDRNQLNWHGTIRLNDPLYNLTLGIAYLKELEDKFKGNREHALIAYNWGPGNLEKAFKGEKTIPGSSMRYARTILTHHKEWKRDYHSKAVEVKANV
jgi:hypothetical protein